MRKWAWVLFDVVCRCEISEEEAEQIQEEVSYCYQKGAVLDQWLRSYNVKMPLANSANQQFLRDRFATYMVSALGEIEIATKILKDDPDMLPHAQYSLA
ncbi:hypothetical protein HPP92_018259 [Vanilla planifolia]|uniref:Uncharacterized protein n=1 Tax=Vanilla planifolia TaxID=51239 RepID=A0A835QBP1_VANPL|nr:hypothetical protein HPP92_018259 [Vanilla planifolia]